MKTWRGVAIITGGGRGIGAACAKIFYEKSYKVFLVSRSEAELKQVCAELDPTGEGVAYSAIDLRMEGSAMLVFERCIKQLGTPSILINNAGKLHLSIIENDTLKQWRDTMALNLEAVFLLTQAAFKRMLPGGSIVNVSSISGVPGTGKLPKLAAYCASKAGVITFSEVTAVEGKDKDLTCVCVSPGSVETQMLRSVVGANFPKAADPASVAQTIFEAATTKRQVWNGKNIELFGQ